MPRATSVVVVVVVVVVQRALPLPLPRWQKGATWRGSGRGAAGKRQGSGRGAAGERRGSGGGAKRACRGDEAAGPPRRATTTTTTTTTTCYVRTLLVEFKDLLPPIRRGLATAENNLPDRPALDAMHDRTRYDDDDDSVMG